MKKRPRLSGSARPVRTAPGAAVPPLTIARTLAQHQSDPQHHFHPPGHPADGRVAVAAGERLQRVRGRAHAG